MGMFLVFAAGYALGTRGGDESLDDVVKALNAIRHSEEFHGLVSAIRTHAASSLRGLATTIETFSDDGGEREGPSDLLERVRLLAGRR
jgi:hypothetical protein